MHISPLIHEEINLQLTYANTLHILKGMHSDLVNAFFKLNTSDIFRI